MSLWAIVPVKPLRRGKSRLSGVLSEEERTLLNYTMLASTLRALTGVPEISQILVVSRDTGALALARDFGAKTVQEDGSSSLNTALQRATIVAQMRGASSLLILPADLPLIQPESIQAMIRLGQKPPVVVIAPDRLRQTTNGLLINPIGLLEYQFGPGSFEKHVRQVQESRVRLELCERQDLALDLDLPEDLEILRHLSEMPASGETSSLDLVDSDNIGGKR